MPLPAVMYCVPPIPVVAYRVCSRVTWGSFWFSRNPSVTEFPPGSPRLQQSVRVERAVWWPTSVDGSDEIDDRRVLHRRPQRIVRALTMSRFSKIGVAPRALCRNERLPLLCRLRLRLNDVERRHRADFDLHLIVTEKFFREVQGLPRDMTDCTANT